MKFRQFTEEEKESEENVHCDGMIDGMLPDDGQECLLTVHACNGLCVAVDIFCVGYECGAYFENWYWEDIIAWAPMPEPYKEGDKT